MLLITILVELCLLYRLQAKAAIIDWQLFGEQIIPLYQGGVYKRLFMAEKNVPLIYESSVRDEVKKWNVELMVKMGRVDLSDRSKEEK